MTRKLEAGKVTVKPVTFSPQTQKVGEWLEMQVASYGKTETFYLLAHADNGVIWGRLSDGKLVTAPVTSFSPALNLKTLQTARLFNSTREIYLWRDGEGGFQSRLIEEGAGDELAHFDEAQILWGTHAKSTENGFALLSDGAQGLRHFVPLKVEAIGNGRPLRLKLRHYLKEDVTGFVRIAFSRLVDLYVARNAGEGG